MPKDGVFIGNCPDEILNTIFLNIPYGTSLVAIACVHECFKRVALPILYKSIRLRADQTSDNHYLSKSRHQLPAALVSDPKGLILRSPSFCAHVQNLSLRVLNTNWYTNSKGHRQLMELLPRIKEITLDPPPRKYDFSVSDQLTTMRLNLPYGFGHFWNPKLWPGYFDLNEYLSNPSLRNIQFNSSYNRFCYNTIHTGNSRSSTIVDLRFINWLPQDVHLLLTVLPSIKRLKHFAIDVDGQWTGPRPPLWGPPKQILVPHDYNHLLQLHKASLEQVVIAYCPRAYRDMEGFGYDSPELPPSRALPVMGSLSNFPRLKRLAIPEHFLVTHKDASIHQLLPPNLEELQIQIIGVRDWYANDVSHELLYYRLRIETLAQNKNEFVPRLKRVVFWIQTPPYDLWIEKCGYTFNTTEGPEDRYEDPISTGFREYMVELKELYQMANVRFDIVLTLDFKNTPFAKYLYL